MKIDNSTHNNSLNITGNNNALGNVSFSSGSNDQSTQPKSDKPKTNFFLSIVGLILKKLKL